MVKELARVQSGIGKLLDAYQDSVLTLDELRQRVPSLRKREEALKAELHSLEAMAIDKQAYLQLAEGVEEFLSRLRASASILSVIERQKILRLVVKEILVDRETIKIRHSIPVTMLSLRLSHRQLTDVFCDEMTEFSHIVRSGGTVLDDGRMRVGG